jgi:hypothetical protein
MPITFILPSLPAYFANFKHIRTRSCLHIIQSSFKDSLSFGKNTSSLTWFWSTSEHSVVSCISALSTLTEPVTVEMGRALLKLRGNLLIKSWVFESMHMESGNARDVTACPISCSDLVYVSKITLPPSVRFCTMKRSLLCEKRFRPYRF